MLSETEKQDRARALADVRQREKTERLEHQVAWLKSTIVSILVLANRGVDSGDIRDICQHALDKQMKFEKQSV